MTSFADPGFMPGQPGGGGGNETRRSTVVLDANVAGYTAQMTAAERVTQGVANSVDRIGGSLEGISKRAGSALTGLAGKDALGLAAAAADAAALQKELGTLNATSAVTGTSMKGIRNEVDGAFSKFPLARGQVVGLVQDISGMGITAPRDIGRVTDTVIKLGAATGENMPQLGQQLVQLNRLMGNLDPRQLGNMANAILTSSKTAGVGAGDILRFSSAIAPMAREAGVGEAAVIGISTAFTKAGADGYVAANTFNSIVNDISTLTKTGSPQLAKYASFLGLTVDQFKRMPAEKQITGIFDAIAKGGPQALMFVQELGLGTRALSAVQAVAQTGGLSQAINVAVSNSTDQHNLDKGARAAFNNLADESARVRNEFTQMGDIIGGPLLTPLMGLEKGLAGFLHIVNQVLKALGPLPAILGVVAGGLGVVAGVGIAHAGIIGGLATARLLASPNSGPRRALREGRAYGAAERAGMSEEDLARLNASSVMYGGGAMPLRARVPFLIGAQQGRAGMGRAAAPSEEGGTRSSFMAGFRQGRNPGEAQAAQREAAAATARTEASVGKMAAGWAARGVFGGPAWLFNQQTKTLRDSRLPDYQRSAYQNLGDKASMSERAAVMNAEMKARLAETGVIKLTAQEAAGLARAMAGTAAETVRAGASMAGAATGGALGRMGMAGGAAAGAGRAAGMAGRGLGAIGGALLSPWSMLALGVGLPVGEGLWHAYSSRRDAANQNAVIGSLNPLEQYNSALGIATTNLASFSSGLKNATPKVGTQSTATTFDQAQTVSKTDVAQYSGQKPTDKTIAALAKHSPHNVAQAQSLLASYGITDPRQLDLFKQNLLASGYKPEEVDKILSGYEQGGQPNLDQLARAINASQNHGMFASNASSSGNKLIGAGLSYIGQQKNADLLNHSAGYAQTKYLQQSLGFLSSQASGAKGTGVDALANTLATLTGGKQSTYQDILGYGPQMFNKDTFNAKSQQEQQQYLLDVIGRTSHGKDFLRSITGAGGTTDVSKLQDYLNKNAGVLSDAQNQAGANFGALGRYTTTNATVTAAAGSQSSNPAVVQQAVTGLSGEAVKASGNYSQAAGSLLQLSDAMGGSATATGQLLASAAAWTRQLQQFSLLGTSRNTQLGSSFRNVEASHSAAMAPGATQQSVDQYKSDLSAYEDQKEQYRQYLLGVYQQAQQFGIQMQRAQEDENTQLYRGERDFYIQMTQAQEDYQRQTMRSRTDFATQEKRQAQQAAQQIYNPFLRVQAQYTTDAGTLLQNLEDQNTRISDQFKQLQQLRDMGVSQQSIDTLDLSNPQNAQQLNNIVQSLMQDPSLIKKINAAIGTRLSATTQLTQSNFNMNFRNTVADFDLALNRASQDYQTAHDRAVAAQQRALTDMSADYNKMIARSGADLKLSMTEITGDFSKMFGNTMSMVNNMVGKYAPGAAAAIDKSLEALRSKYPGLFYDADLASLSGSGGGSAGGRALKLAAGGITTRPVMAEVSEAGYPEAHIPLNERGQNFMTGLIVKSLAQVMSASAPVQNYSSSSSADHSVSYAGANIEVKADDPRKMEQELERRRKMKRLTSPARRAG